MSVLAVNSSTFESEVLSSDLPVVVDFWASWCGPCRMMGPVFDDAAAEMEGKAKFFKLNVDENGEIAQRYGVMTIPTLIVFKNGAEVNRSVGVVPKAKLLSLL